MVIEMMVKKKGNFGPFMICMIVLGLLLVGSATNVVANEPPVADADPDHQTVAAGEEAYFSGSASYDPDGRIVAYYWIFGDGLVYEGVEITYTFNTPGDHTVSLTVEDDMGNQDTDYVTVTVVEEPPSEPPEVWIESLATDKADYDVNETVFTTATVQRGDDLLTSVWEGSLVLDVLDQGFVIKHNDERPVYLPHGGASETHEFEFVLAESGDYFVRTSLFDMHNELMDVKEVTIRVGDDNSGGNGTPPPNDRMVWIEFLTTDKSEYEVNDVVETEVVIKRGEDQTDVEWKGILILEVFDPLMDLIFYDEQKVTIPCDISTQTFNYDFTVTSEGDHLISATLYDQNDELMDQKEICIKVGDEGTPPPNHGMRLAWIQSFTTDKGIYDVNEEIAAQAIVERGDDLLTYVWEGTLVLEVLDESGDILFSEERAVYLPYGGAEETHDFSFTLTEDGNYVVRATLYDLDDEVNDIREIKIVVGDDNSGGTRPDDGDGTSDDREEPPNDREDPPDHREEPPDDRDGTPDKRDENETPDDHGLFSGDRAGALEGESEKQAAMIIVVLVVMVGLCALATLCYYRRHLKKRS
jgi:PKD repeat protein